MRRLYLTPSPLNDFPERPLGYQGGLADLGAVGGSFEDVLNVAELAMAESSAASDASPREEPVKVATRRRGGPAIPIGHLTNGFITQAHFQWCLTCDLRLLNG